MSHLEQSFSVKFEYKIFFTSSLFDPKNTVLADFFKKQHAISIRKIYFVIDQGVADTHPELINDIRTYFTVHQEMQLLQDIMLVPGGEAAKNDPQLFEQIVEAVNQYGIDRHSYIAAIGGGAVLDLVGYAAAVSHRGIKHIRIPTTVLSQNDSGIGVKNGINYRGKKNFLGTFAPPNAVFNDDDFLLTLTDRDYRSGISEAIKVALIKDPEFFYWIAENTGGLVKRDQKTMNYLIRRCAELHLNHIGGDDPFETGSARPLDFGHWAAHKLEQLSNFEVLHGEAVAMGIALDSSYSYLKGMLSESELQRILKVLIQLGYDISNPHIRIKDLHSPILLGLTEFQEHLGGLLSITLLTAIGTGREVHEMDQQVLIEASNYVYQAIQNEMEEVHLTYCTNIHPGKNWEEDFAALKLNFPIIKQNVSPEQAMGLGLRLSNASSLELEKPEVLALFQQWLREQDAYVFTMNGFPYGEFHRTVVKADVHAPDWTTDERKDYTIRIFRILKQLLPEGLEGGISTSPLSYRHWFKTPESLNAATEKATQNLIEVLKYLIEVFKETGIIMHLDMEPEPDGIIETGAEFIGWFENSLLPLGIPEIAQSFRISEAEAKDLLHQHLCLCYDVCHFAMGYEDHAAVLHELESKGIRVGKIQISAALKADMDRDGQEKLSIRKAFEQFNEPTYLHQVVARKKDGSLLRYKDLPEAFGDFENEEVLEWRSHFHVPISIREIGTLSSTQSDIEAVLALQKAKPFTSHLEVETYTWEVLPEQLKLPMAQSISKELNWVKQTLA